jgi:predicted RNase H-like nuclease
MLCYSVETMDTYVVGVYGCKSGWIICRYEASSGHVSFDVLPSFSEILERENSAEVIAMDVPIGLTEDSSPRHCDLEARRLLSRPRASSVFPAPARCLLSEQSYPNACVRSLTLREKGVSKQAFAIYPKIAEVDCRMRPELQTHVFEVHPEVCFWGIGRSAMHHNKKTREGYDERRRMLADMLPFRFPERRQFRQLGLSAQPDDVLDAAIAAVTAERISRGVAERLPHNQEFDNTGLRMEIVY